MFATDGVFLASSARYVRPPTCEQSFLVQLLVQGNHVEWLVGVGQLVHGTEDQAVVMPIEIAVRYLIQHPLPGVVVQHQATEHGLFGLDGMRRHLQGLRFAGQAVRKW